MKTEILHKQKSGDQVTNHMGFILHSFIYFLAIVRQIRQQVLMF